MEPIFFKNPRPAFLTLAPRLALTLVLTLGLTALSACGQYTTRTASWAVGSSTVLPFAKQVAEGFAFSYPEHKSPLIESTGTGGGIRLFCAGLGPEHPDMANASRRMKVSEFDDCASNDVSEIIELQVGLDGIAFASAREGIALNLSPRIVYEAIAARPYGNEQTATTWSDIDPALPDDPILIYGPPSQSGTRDALNELVLMIGCDTNAAMRVLRRTDPEQHRKLCTEIRTDGAFSDQGEQDNMIVQKIVANPRSIGLFGFSYLEENTDNVQGLPMSGVLPTYDNIASFAYPGARPLYIYVKKAHLATIPGLRLYLQEWVKNWDRGGRLAKIGLVAMPKEAMIRNAAKVDKLTTISRADLAANR